MITSIQKASLLKRISASLLDVILTAIISVGIAYALSLIIGYDKHLDNLESKYEYYETTYDVEFGKDPSELTEEEYQIRVYSQDEISDNAKSVQESFTGPKKVSSSTYFKDLSIYSIILTNDIYSLFCIYYHSCFFNFFIYF